MSMRCPGNRSIGRLVTAVAMSNLLAVAAAAASDDQRPQVQKLFQAGSYDEAVQAAQGGDPASIYLAAQSLMRMEQGDRANAEFAKLTSSGDGAWQAVGESGQALVANDAARAVEAARRATAAGGDNPFAHYQLGLATSKAGDFATASSALSRAAELKPDSPTRTITRGSPISVSACCRKRRSTSTRSSSSRPMRRNGQPSSRL